VSGFVLDHVLVFVAGPAEAEAAVERLGLVPTYRRAHTGQGTANICCSFGDAFLELIWVDDRAAARSEPAARLGLADRAPGGSALPLGIALRGGPQPLPFPAWSYRPAWLPEGMAIDVAELSADPRQPLLIRLSGGRRSAGSQHAAGLGEITGLVLGGSAAALSVWSGLVDTDPALRGLELIVARLQGGTRRLRLPELVWLDHAGI
jgi:hypothetical protein